MVGIFYHQYAGLTIWGVGLVWHTPLSEPFGTTHFVPTGHLNPTLPLLSQTMGFGVGASVGNGVGCGTRGGVIGKTGCLNLAAFDCTSWEVNVALTKAGSNITRLNMPNNRTF